MARGDEPLLQRRPSSELSNNDRDIAEEDALLTEGAGQSVRGPRRNRLRTWREIGAFVWAFLATLIVIVLAVLYGQSQSQQHASLKPHGKRNLVFMISDGMGPTSMSLTRSFKQYQEGLPETAALTLDKYVIGQSRTRSTSSLITDSAAGATAFSCGKKSYNGAISTLPDYTPCGSVMEAAKNAGYMTGLVVTTRITDATPACFAAHVNKRDEEDRIAEQLLGDYPLGRTVDLMFGAGRCHFLPNTTDGSCRADNKDMIARAKENGFRYIDNRKDFDGLGHAPELPLLGLFADHDIPYEVDRVHENDVYPSLAEMVKTALNALNKATRKNGFFLMIEGSRIDHAGHANDAVAQVHEVLAYDRAVEAVLEFLEKDSVQGLMVSTSDHETGGLATARQLHPFIYPEYRWFPALFANATHSSEWLSNDYFEYLRSTHDLTSKLPRRDRNNDNYTDPAYHKGGVAAVGGPGKPFHQSSSSSSPTPAATTSPTSSYNTASYIRHSLLTHLGISDATDAEVDLLVSRPAFAPWTFADIISRRSQTGWSTHGHSGADVNIYASDAEVARNLVGSRENTEVGVFLREYLDVDVDAVTRELVEKGAGWGGGAGMDWMGRRPEVGERVEGGSHLDHYEGDFKKHKRCEICDV